MKTFSYISLSITLALAFATWLPGRYALTIIMYSSFVLPFLLIADIAAIVYLIRHRKEKAVKWLATLLVAIPVVGAIGFCAPWNSVSDKTMSKHFHRHEKELRELVSLELLGKTGCESIKTHSLFDNATWVTYRTVVFTSHGYLFYPDGSVKILRWDPLGSDTSGTYDLLP